MAHRNWKQVERWAEQHGLEIQARKKRDRRKILQRMNQDPEYCYCADIFGYFNVPRSDSDPIVSTFEYHHKYDFMRERPKHKANVRRCHICGGQYSDAPPMA